METLLDILTGIGLACAAGIRPFLPALVAGAFASANLTLDFGGTDLAFLEQSGWLLGVVVALIAVVLANRALGPERAESGPGGAVLLALALGIGALLFAGALADHADVWWPGLLGGALVAVLAFRVSRELLARTRSRLDDETASALTVYAEGAALVTAVLAVLAPPLSLAAAGFLVFLLVKSRRRQGEKYAGLRILR